MNIRPTRFNIYLLCLALLAPAIGCRSPESRREKQLAVLRLHIEAYRDSADLSELVPVYRENPTMVNVDRNSFLKESDVAKAKVIVDALGGFALQIQFTPHGSILLEQYTASNPGRRLAVYAEFGEKLVEHRWLGAPVITRRLSNGTLSFTPDATREETDQIVIGLNNVAIKNGNQDKPKKSKAKAE